MRVVIADDSALLREGLARLLVESGVEVCATAADADGAGRRRAPATAPDVAIVDIRMPPTYTHEGAAAAVELRERAARTSACSCCRRRSRRTSPPSCSSGTPSGSATCSRTGSSTSQTLVDALHTIAAGGTVLDPEIVRHLMRRGTPPTRSRR